MYVCPPDIARCYPLKAKVDSNEHQGWTKIWSSPDSARWRSDDTKELFIVWSHHFHSRSHIYCKSGRWPYVTAEFSSIRSKLNNLWKIYVVTVRFSENQACRPRWSIVLPCAPQRSSGFLCWRIAAFVHWMFNPRERSAQGAWSLKLARCNPKRTPKDY